MNGTEEAAVLLTTTLALWSGGLWFYEARKQKRTEPPHRPRGMDSEGGRP
jgi:hypothetical protein